MDISHNFEKILPLHFFLISERVRRIFDFIVEVNIDRTQNHKKISITDANID